jgi:hypothetical protein
VYQFASPNYYEPMEETPIWMWLRRLRKII